ncbi:hypothetical protein Cgig2_011960 [Carnegiea gigantea]|uniref:Uncharacterized protein n=1 Tax=Carnegiea gigantea TaxID=171969 RepID=A0A9Q1GQI6_9CARY|nr:hypothetical protein Cgig2_011960 [Carnegiea gigantea]
MDQVFVCSKQGYREPRKTPPQSAVALANAISRVRENVKERRVKWRRVETREGCNARMVVSSTNDGQFETKLAAKKPIFELDIIVSISYAQVGYNALCLAIGVTPSLASDVPTPFYPPFLQNSLDMPGVAQNGIKIFKSSEKDMVTFSATALKKESFPYDESERVYVGIVQLNKDPNDLLVEVFVENGSVSVFFPTADGYLLFLP